MSTIPKLAVLLLLSLWFVSLAFAQGGATGAIGGVVQGICGGPVPGGASR